MKKTHEQLCRTIMYQNEVYVRAIDLVELFSNSDEPSDKVFLQSLIKISKPENFK